MPTFFRILLMLCENRDDDRVVDAAIKEAIEKREGGAEVELTFKFVHEGKRTAWAKRSLRTQGFLGSKATETVIEALEEEQKLLAMERMRHVQGAATAAGLRLEVLSRTGSFSDAVVAAAAERRYDVIYMARARWQGLREVLHEWEPVVRYAKQTNEEPV